MNYDERRFNIAFLSACLIVLISVMGLYIILEIEEAHANINLSTTSYNIQENII
jgi:hypothetical protein